VPPARRGFLPPAREAGLIRRPAAAAKVGGIRQLDPEDTMTAITTTTAHRLPVAVRIGIVLATVSALADVVVNAFTFPDLGAFLGVGIGAATLVLVPFAWRGHRGSRIGVAVTRVLTGLIGVPALFSDGVPAGGMIAAAVGVVAEMVIAVLVLRPVRA
jgi:hypothetical protein